ncbi:zinc finger CCCH domain-containing protein 10-like [Montipora capricornis]|uniref:zinc finger CCCH domain-containing protein 10-like n=1 Tax=Montipora capricornis TaxID=246305 RepID=UPI0035F1113B
MDMHENPKDNDTNNNATDKSLDVKDLICRDYQRGVCTRGPKCKFQHPDGMGTELTNSPMICRDYQNGKCQRSTCKYLHLSNNEEKIFLRTGQMPPKRDSFYANRGEPTRAGPNDPVCKDYLNRKCSRGQGCRYRHVFEDGPDSDYGGYGFDGPYGKRRRESYDGQNYYYLVDENESLRRKVADLQKQVTDLKATNEVLLEQNAKYRNQIGERSSHNGGGSNNTTGYPSTYATSSSQSYATSYPPQDSYPAKNTYTTYTFTPTAASSTYTSATSYTSNSAYGAGYTKFD